MKNILVIGASGFVGSYLTRQLLADGYLVRCLARTPGKVQQLAGLGGEIVQGDIADALSVEKALMGMDAVYISIHTLAPQHSLTSEENFMDIEWNGLKNVVEACKKHGVSRLVYVTSLGISAHTKDAWTSGRWKIQRYLLSSGLDVTVIQPGMIVGLGGQGFNMVLANARKNLAVVIGNGRNKFRIIAIDDLVYDLIGVLSDPRAYGQCFEVGSDDVLTADELIDMAADVVGLKRPAKLHVSLALLRFIAPLIQFLAKSPKGAIKGALDSLGKDMIGDPSAVRELLPREPLSYKQAVERALAVHQQK